mmetsp:Transcript_95696/g.143347  ORF Transcript_95696/g.143347 Transcript_95696/m.143347 type:complete len:115 (+) Transcript_95696:443-787(+)
MTQPFQRGRIQFHTNPRHGIAGNVGFLLGDQHDIRLILQRFATPQDEGLGHFGLDGTESEFGAFVLVHGEIDAGIAEIANAVEEYDGPYVIGKGVGSELFPIPIDDLAFRFLFR